MSKIASENLIKLVEWIEYAMLYVEPVENKSEGYFVYKIDFTPLKGFDIRMEDLYSLFFEYSRTKLSPRMEIFECVDPYEIFEPNMDATDTFFKIKSSSRLEDVVISIREYYNQYHQDGSKEKTLYFNEHKGVSDHRDFQKERTYKTRKNRALLIKRIFGGESLTEKQIKKEYNYSNVSKEIKAINDTLSRKFNLTFKPIVNDSRGYYLNDKVMPST